MDKRANSNFYKKIKNNNVQIKNKNNHNRVCKNNISASHLSNKKNSDEQLNLEEILIFLRMIGLCIGKNY
ncbi:putative ORFan [Tupanvirus deep ocean]|uniref:ORFan n=2 Tax=Tupanvirus TaxID=2094720 RepID=A0AC62A7I7_9VIRU|nr:putative ORFan [Tupanvirus deep ocean]QKU33679.1 putative ORFan [Tupanvirus deep ocean]